MGQHVDLGGAVTGQRLGLPELELYYSCKFSAFADEAGELVLVGWYEPPLTSFSSSFPGEYDTAYYAARVLGS